MALWGYETLRPFSRGDTRSPTPIYLSPRTPIEHARSFVSRGGVCRLGEDVGTGFGRQEKAFKTIRTAEEGPALLEMGKIPSKRQVKAMAETGHMAHSEYQNGGPLETDDYSLEFKPTYNQSDLDPIRGLLALAKQTATQHSALNHQ